jgi:hypothetical protein
MARTAQGDRLSTRHRSQQLTIRNLAIRDLLALWQTVRVDDITATIMPFLAAAPSVVAARFTMSAQTALDYYRELRIVEGASMITSLNTLPLPEPPAATKTMSLLRGAGIAGIVNGRRKGFTPEAALQNGFVKVAGSASGLILDAARETIIQTARADPASTGRWQRIAGLNSCDFCSMLADRGPVFTEETGGFQAHNHDGCTAEPEFT